MGRSIKLMIIALLIIAGVVTTGCSAVDPLTDDLYIRGVLYVWDPGTLAYVPVGGGGGVNDHGLLNGLADDDHPQYAFDGDVVTDHGGLNGLADNDHPQYVLDTDVDDVAVNGATTDPISSNWAFDHDADTTSVHGINDTSALLTTGDIDDTPSNGDTSDAISSNWAYDHATSDSAHNDYMVWKDSAETVNSQAVLQDDDELSFAVEPSKFYVVEVYLLVQSVTAADVRFGWNYPANTLIWWGDYTKWSTTADPYTESSNATYATTNNVQLMIFRGTVNTNAVVGNGTVTLKWAQWTSNAGNTTVYQGSYIEYKVWSS